MNKPSPKITIFTLCFNNFQFLEKTINSVFCQKYNGEIEYFVCDDGSDCFPLDKYNEIIEKFSKNNDHINVSLLLNKENKGTVCRINEILSLSSGLIFCPLSCNDFFTSDNILSSVSNLFDYKNNIALVCSREVLSESGETIGVSPNKFEKKHINKIAKTNSEFMKAIIEGEFYNFASGSATYYSTNLLKKRGGFNKSFYLWEDLPFYYEAFKFGETIQFSYDLTSIFYTTGGVSSKRRKMNPNMLIDSKLFNNIYRKNDLLNFGFLCRRKAKFIISFYNDYDGVLKFGLFFKFFDVFLYKMIRKIFRKMVGHKSSI